MSTLALNSNNDIYFNYQGKLEVINNKNSDEEILQKIKIRLRFFKEEWFLNLEHGLPYFQSIFDYEENGDLYILGNKNLDLNILENIFREQILDIEGVKSLIQSEVTYDFQNRQINYYFEVTSINNTKVIDNLTIL